MALTKQPVNINFSKGLDTKSDPYQVPIGSFLTLVNSVFTSAGRLTKRNGFATITTLPDLNETTLTTLNDNLIATGSNLFAFSADTDQWINQGLIQPVQLNTQPLLRASTSQTSPDSAVAANGLACTVYIDSGVAYYIITDTNNGQQIVKRTAIAAGAILPRTFMLGVFFIITYVNGSNDLNFIAIPIANLFTPTAPTLISVTSPLSSSTAGYDGFVTNNQLFIAWGAADGSVKVTYVNQILLVAGPASIAASTASRVSVTADTVHARVWISWIDTASTSGFSANFTYSLVPIVGKTGWIAPSVTYDGLTSSIIPGTTSLLVFVQVLNSYTYSGGGRSDYIETFKITPTGTGASVFGPTVILRSVSLASKSFVTGTTVFTVVEYGDTAQPTAERTNQPSYFLIDGSGNIYMRLAYSNGGGYAINQVLPSVSTVNGTYNLPYLIVDLLATVNKTVNPGQPVNAIFTQTGINLASFTLNTNQQHSNEIAGALHLTGGQLWEYDGVKPVEHGFQVWPENVVAGATGAGGIPDGTYSYSFTYEWTDNAGNLHRSAPSIPTPLMTISGSPVTITIDVPTLRLTYKTAPNPVRIVGYRWSVAQPVFYQFTSITAPVSNTAGTSSTWTDGTNTDTSTTGVDSVTITDTFPDASILGNVILYTTGGVIEDIAAPASVASCLFANRLFLIDAEDQNLLWFSKQVIENVPVEMSDLLTLYIAPTTGAQGSTGPMTALSAMDDKLIIFKKDAIYYVNGAGPDNTGANSTFSDPIFITATVGCANPNSVVLMPNGIMFQSDKGIWLLGRDLSTTYIGAPVEGFNNQVVMSATAIPGTNEVRFVLANSVTLMYDYFFGQWVSNTNLSAISATLYQAKHTYLNQFGQVLQETPNLYTDNSEPVLMSLTTAWINIAGLQGFERFYFGYLLGTYLSPFTLNVSLAYDYSKGPSQSLIVSPANAAPAWGSEANWGSGGPWGGNRYTDVFEARFFPVMQKCESFQVNIQEVFDPSLGMAPGAGLTLSGLSLIIGTKKGYRTQSAKRSFG